ncbi:hypothetical protein [Ardenticatena maritima]|nr:hypothetical protein [Ardenticatena maritima]
MKRILHCAGYHRPFIDFVKREFFPGQGAIASLNEFYRMERLQPRSNQ